jgi:opacity protein-like surface antigen
MGPNTMKEILIASAFAVGVAGSAVAADMPAAYKVAPVARPACAQFGGWYVGANVGYGYLEHNFQDRDFIAASIDTGLPRSTRDTKNA